MPLGTGSFDFRRLLNTLDGMHFGGYVVIDSATDAPEFTGPRLGCGFLLLRLAIFYPDHMRIATGKPPPCQTAFVPSPTDDRVAQDARRQPIAI